MSNLNSKNEKSICTETNNKFIYLFIILLFIYYIYYFVAFRDIKNFGVSVFFNHLYFVNIVFHTLNIPRKLTNVDSDKKSNFIIQYISYNI